MILLIDIGNTRIKLGWIRPATGEREAVPVALPVTALDDLDRWLGQLPARPVHALGVNVASTAIAHTVRAKIAPLVGRDESIVWVQSTHEAMGVRNAYQPIGQLGADRWAAMLGLAWHVRREAGLVPAPQSAVLATFGTATTIDTLVFDAGNETGTFMGGLILPGAELMKSSLANGTANLPRAHSTTALFPTHTHQAIITGIAAAQAGAVVRQWLAALHESGQAPAMYVAGGAWPAMRDEVERLVANIQQATGQTLTLPTYLSAPILDGLACLALDTDYRQLYGASSVG